MDNVRGLRTRLCPKCDEITPHRTLYVRTTTSDRRRWLQLFWACTKCESLNHILLPAYRLEWASSPPPSALAVAIVNALEEGPLDFDQLMMSLRRRRVAGVRHIFNSEVALAIEFLKGRDVVAEENRDWTEKALESLRAQSVGSKRLGVCPVEFGLDLPSRSLVSLYAQKRKGEAQGMTLVPAGVLCLHCQYHRINL
jgi:hypothetical protein